MIEVDRSGVLGQEGKLDAVRRGNGSAQGVLVDIPDLKVLEETPLPAVFRLHRGTPLVGVHSFDSPSLISISRRSSFVWSSSNSAAGCSVMTWPFPFRLLVITPLSQYSSDSSRVTSLGARSLSGPNEG